MRTVIASRPNASVQLGNRLFHFDGINTNRVDDGNPTNPLMLRMNGILPPTTAVTLAQPGGGNVENGVHLVYVTFVIIVAGTALVESNPSPVATITVAGGPKQVDISAIPISTNAAVNGRRIYVTSAGGNSPVKVLTNVAELQNNTATTYAYNTADVNLSSIPLLTSNAVLPTSCYAASYGNRLIVGGSIGKINEVLFTNASLNFSVISGPILLDGDTGKAIILSDSITAYTIATVNESAQTGTLTVAYQGTTSVARGDLVTIIGDPNLVTIGNPIGENIEGYDPLADAQFEVGQDDGQYLRAIKPFHQTLVFGKARAIYQLVGDIITDPTTGPSYRIDIITNKVGIASHFAAQNMQGGGLIFYGGDGIYLLDNSTPVKVTGLIDPLFDPSIESAITLGGEDCRVDHTYDEVSHGVFNPVTQQYFLWVARQANSTAIRKCLDLCIMLDFKKKNSLSQPSAWAFLIPASLSLGYQDVVAQKFRVLIGTYHSKMLELFGGYRDGIPTISTGSTNYLFKVSAVTAATATSGTRLTFSAVAPYGGYQDVTGGSMGLPVVGVSGARKGVFRVIKNYVSSNIVEIDEELYATNTFAVDDIVTIGGYQALWTGNQNTMGAINQLKRGSRLKTTFDIPAFTSVDT